MEKKEQDNKAMQPLSEAELNEVNGGKTAKVTFALTRCEICGCSIHLTEYHRHIQQHLEEKEESMGERAMRLLLSRLEQEKDFQS